MGTIPIPQDATIGDTPQSSSTTVPIPSDAVVQNEGEEINDVGNAVIVPKEGESFADTMARAAAHGKTVTPEQIHSELQTAPAKAATVLAAAPVIGAAGAAGLAAPGAVAHALPSVLPHTIEGVKAIGVWAEAHPVQAYILYQVMKELVPGAKKAMGIIKAAPTGE